MRLPPVALAVALLCVPASAEVTSSSAIHFDIERARFNGDLTLDPFGQEAANGGAQILHHGPHGDHMSELPVLKVERRQLCCQNGSLLTRPENLIDRPV